MATHSSVLAWRIPGKGEPGGLPSVGSHRVRHDWSDLVAAAASSNFKNNEYRTVLASFFLQSVDVVAAGFWLPSGVWFFFNPMDCSLPGFSVHGISQARMLEWVVIPFFRGSFQARDQTCISSHWQVDSLPLSHLGSPSWWWQWSWKLYKTDCCNDYTTMWIT